MATLVQVVSIEPAQAVLNDIGPGPVPGASTELLANTDRQWESKNQHRIWRNGTRWDAILPTATGWQIAQGAIPATFGAVPTYGPAVAGAGADRPDIYWDNTANRLYVLMSGTGSTLHVFNYTGAAYVPMHSSAVPAMDPGEGRAAIYKTPNGFLWASMMTDAGLFVARSNNDGVSWSPPVKLHNPVAEGQTQLAHFTFGATTQIGVIAAEDGDDSAVSQYLFYRLDQTAANWNLVSNATATITLGTQPVPGDVIAIADKPYQFTNVAFPVDANGEPQQIDGLVAIGATLAVTQDNLEQAVNFDGTNEGIAYAEGMTGNRLASIGNFAGNVATISARESGTGGNGIPVSATNAAVVFSSPTLIGGASPWTRELIPLSSTSGLTHADDEISLIRNTNGDLYAATETQHPGGNSTTMHADPQVIVFKREQQSGNWTQHVVKMDDTTSNTDRKRPVVAIQDGTLYVIAIHQNQIESGYRTALLSNLVFDTTFNAPWTPLINTPFEKFRNNIVPREPTTAATKLPVLIDWAWDDCGSCDPITVQDSTIWQTSLPNAGNQVPGVFAGVDKTVASSPGLGGVVSDTDGVAADAPIGPLWTVVSGPGIVTFNNAGDPNTGATFSAFGTYVLRLTAFETGPNALTNFDEVTVTAAPNSPPTLSVAEPDNGETVALGADMVFQATANDTQDGDISAAIVWRSDGVIIGFGGSFVRSNLTQGSHTITATVSDGEFTVTSPNITVNIGGGGGPVPGGGGNAPFAAVQTTTGIWKLYHGQAQVASFFYGNPGDHAFMGDWNCDGVKTPGLYRRSDGYVYLRNSNTQGVADVAFFFGNPGDLPMAGDFNNDGCDTVSIYRPAEGRFYIMNHLGAGDAGLGAADFAYYFGNPGDSPFMGDWEGDGIDTPGLRRNSDGFVYLRNSNTQGIGEQVYFYGDSGDVVFTGDWDRDGDDTLGLYRPSNGFVFLRNTNSTGIADATIAVGGGMQAVGGKF